MLSGTQRRSPISRHRRSNGTGVGRFHLVAERHAASAASDDLAGAPSAPPPGPGTMSGSRAGALTPACAARPCAVCGAPVQAGHRGRFHLADVPAHTPGPSGPSRAKSASGPPARRRWLPRRPTGRRCVGRRGVGMYSNNGKPERPAGAFLFVCGGRGRGVLPGRHGAGYERGPSVHQPAPLVEQIASRVTPLDSPAPPRGQGPAPPHPSSGNGKYKRDPCGHVKRGPPETGAVAGIEAVCVP